jgi:anoctamin-3
LINNLIEIRLDAWKLLWKYKRPIPYKASNIGIWNDILSAVSYFAVLTNVKSSVLNKNYRNIFSRQ